jgi:hypothetical protein
MLHWLSCPVAICGAKRRSGWTDQQGGGWHVIALNTLMALLLLLDPETEHATQVQHGMETWVLESDCPLPAFSACSVDA